MKYGILDTESDCLMGHKDGPILVPTQDEANQIAILFNKMFEAPGRFHCEAVPETEKYRAADTVESKHSPDEALKLLAKEILDDPDHDSH